MTVHLALLLSDWLIYGLLVCIIIWLTWMSRRPHFRAKWRSVLQTRLAMMACIILLAYSTIGLLDSFHVQITRSNQVSRTVSLLDIMLGTVANNQEQTYSAPFALYGFNRVIMVQANGNVKMHYPRLHYAAPYLQNNQQRIADIMHRVLRGFVIGVLSFVIALMLIVIFLNRGRWSLTWRYLVLCYKDTHSDIAWRTGLITLGVLWLLVVISSQLIFSYHVFGTDKVGTDVFYLAVKSIRTGLLIGTLTTLLMLPLALLLGMAAGYFRGWVDDVIQYLYTTLSSIPSVLLISAMVLVLDVYMGRHDYLFPTLEQRADIRLLALCLILGITSWSTLCRLLRGETLKIRHLEFVTAARAFGVRQPIIILRHIMPNVMHIVIITLVLDFSSLVLMEAVLSYIGVGVDPSMISWGNMINSSRLEMAREPVVWWPLVAALIFMFTLVLAANLLADAVRDAFDPSLHQQQR